MKASMIGVFAAIIGCACASSMKHDEVKKKDSKKDDASSAMQEVAFTCNNGESLSVRFSTTQNRALLIRGSHIIELPQQRSGSGFIYSDGHDTIRGKGGDLMVESKRMVPISCKAVDWP